MLVRLQAHRLAQVDLLLGQRAIVQLVPESGLARDQVEHLAARCLLDGHDDRPIEHLVDARPHVRVALGRQRRDLLFLVLRLGFASASCEDRLRLLLLFGGLLSWDRPSSSPSSPLRLSSFGGRRGQLVEPADAEPAVRRRDDGDVQEPAIGQVLQGVLIGAAPDRNGTGIVSSAS